MRTRALVVIALLTLPAGLSAQGIRLPRIGKRTPPQAAPLPPEAPGITRALAYKRSRWSTEGYSLFSAVTEPATGGGSASYTTVGTGTHADYRHTERFSATLDLTLSAFGSPTIAGTAEVGTRFRPLPSWDEELRPFFDVRAEYMYAYDQQSLDGRRYNRGLGGVAGAGLEYSLTRSLAVTTELSALRNRMKTDRATGPSRIPAGTSYWMTSYRLMLGLKYNPVRALHMAQKPAS